MDIRASMSIEALRSTAYRKNESNGVKLEAKEIGRMLFNSSSKRDDWLKENVVSSDFTLLTIPLSRISIINSFNAVDIQASLEEKPLVVDCNKNKVGRIAGGSYYPKVIVIEGSSRYNSARLSGKAMVKAWVGNEAAKLIGIYADHQFGAQELQSKLAECLKDKLVPKKKSGESIGPWPYIQEVYPFESYAIYSYDAKLYKQNFKYDDKKRTVSLDGDPEQVVQKYVDLDANMGVTTNKPIVTPMMKAVQTTPIGNQPKVLGGKFISNATAPGSGVGPQIRKPIFSTVNASKKKNK
jgi:hypothetical protein